MAKALAREAELHARLAALEGPEWNSDSEEEEGEANAEHIALPSIDTALAQPAAAASAALKEHATGKKGKGAADGGEEGDEPSTVIYLGHIPHGFYETQMSGFFEQFGKVRRLRLSRSKRTAGSKGYAFIEFEVPHVAHVVASAMHGCVRHTSYMRSRVGVGPPREPPILPPTFDRCRPPYAARLMLADTLRSLPCRRRRYLRLTP